MNRSPGGQALNRLRAGAAIAAILTVFAASGCGTSPSQASPSRRASTPAPAPSEVLLTGTKLRTLLLPASAVPAGFTLDAAGARDSATTVMADTAASVPAAKACPMLMSSAWIMAAGISGATFAQNDYLDASRTSQYGQEIDTFHGSDAQQVMARLWSVFGHCATFSYTYRGMTGTVTATRSALAGAGDEAIRLTMVTPIFQGGDTLVAIRVGRSVVTCFYSSASKDRGASVTGMATHIARNLQATGGA